MEIKDLRCNHPVPKAEIGTVNKVKISAVFSEIGRFLKILDYSLVNVFVDHSHKIQKENNPFVLNQQFYTTPVHQAQPGMINQSIVCN